MRARKAPLLVAVAAAVTPLWWPHHAEAGTLLCPQPSVTNISPVTAATGATITVTGSGFQASGCSTLVHVGAGAATPSSVQAGTITFAAGAGLSGPVTVQVTDAAGNVNASNSNLLFFTTPTVSGVSPNAPSVGQAVTVTGRGFNLGLAAGDEGVAASYLWQDGSDCQPATATVVSDTTISLTAPTQYCDGPVALAITAPSDMSTPSAPHVPVYSGTPAAIDVAAAGVTLATTSAVAGTAALVHGTGLGSAGNAWVGGAAAPSSWNDTQVSVTVPDNAVSNSAITLQRAADGASIVVPGALAVTARVDAVSPPVASVGSTVTIAGGGFGPSAGTVRLGSVSLPVRSWSPTSISVSLVAGVLSGPLTVTPVDTNPPSAAPTLTVAPSITRITPSSLHPGDTFEVVGDGFGDQQGPGSALTINGNAAPVELWGDEQIVATVPASVAPGNARVVVTIPPAPPASGAVSITAAAAGASSTAANSILQPNPAGPVVGSSPPPWHAPAPPSGPVTLLLTTRSPSAAPGAAVPFTVTLRAFGQPVVGASVQLLVVYEPGRDGSITPSTAVTDAQGQVHGFIHLSSTAGEMIVFARSGQFSNEIRVIGAKNTASHVALSALGSVRSSMSGFLVIVIVTVASALLVAGVGLRLASGPAAGDVFLALLRRAGRRRGRSLWPRR